MTKIAESCDWGPVEIDEIVGKTWLIYWPLREFGVVPHHDYPELNGE